MANVCLFIKSKDCFGEVEIYFFCDSAGRGVHVFDVFSVLEDECFVGVKSCGDNVEDVVLCPCVDLFEC